MFKKLTEDAAKIEIGLKKLQQRMPFLIHNYKYHNRDAGKVLNEKFDEIHSIGSELSQFQETNSEFVATLKEFEDTERDFRRELNDIADELQIEFPEDLRQDEAAESNNGLVDAFNLEEMGIQLLSPNTSHTNGNDSHLYNVAIEKIGAPETPAFRPHSTRKARFH